MKLTKLEIWVAGGWLAFQILFWLLGHSHIMTTLTAFLGVNMLTIVYAALVWVVLKKILVKK